MLVRHGGMDRWEKGTAGRHGPLGKPGPIWEPDSAAAIIDWIGKLLMDTMSRDSWGEGQLHTPWAKVAKTTSGQPQCWMDVHHTGSQIMRALPGMALRPPREKRGCSS